MKTLQNFKSSKDTLIARYVKETSVVDYSDKYRVDRKYLAKSMLTSMEKIKQLGEAGRKF